MQNVEAAFANVQPEAESDDENSLNVQSFMATFFENYYSSSSSSDSEEAASKNVQDFLQTVESFDDVVFASHFRLQRGTAEYLVDMYKNSAILPTNTAGKVSVGAQKEIYVFLWYLANTVTYRQMSNIFNLASSTIRIVLIRVSAWIISIGHTFVTWPVNPENNAVKFEERRGIPSVVGAIDCTHIRIKAPKEHKQDFFNRKHHYSINLQAVVNCDCMFIDIYCGEPGSLHDSRVFRKSELYAKVMENPEAFFPNNTFIIGDSAYNVLQWLVPPFKNYGAMTQLQKNFNFLHSSTRMPIERAFGLLKNRFRRLLHFCELSDLNLIVNLVLSACVLHNMCILQKDTTVFAEEDELSDIIVVNENSIDASSNRRDLLIEELIRKGILRRG